MLDRVREPPAPKRPPAPIPHEAPLGFWAFFRAIRANGIAAWSRLAFEEPFVHVPPGRHMPGFLLVTEPKLVKRVMVDASHLYDKGDVVRRRLKPFLGDGLLIAREESWRPQRRITAPLFQPRRVDAFFPVMLEAARRSARALPGAPFDLGEAMSLLTYEVISRTAFSAEGVKDPVAFSKAISAYFDTLGRVDIASYLRLPEWLPTLGRLRARPALKYFEREIGGAIARRRAALADQGAAALPDDLLTRMLTTPDPQTGQPMADALVYDNTATFLAAGHETTANTLTWVLFLLSEFPDWDALVAGEIAEVVGAGELEPHHLPRLLLTRQVVDEALRLYPPAPIIPRTALAPDPEMPVALKPGDLVFAAPYISQRHRALWEAPDQFQPERFSGGARERIDRHAYFPFGLGPRVCMGAGFAIQEILVALVELLRRWRVEALQPERVFPLATITLRPAERLMARAVAR